MIPRLLVVFTGQLEILATILSEGNSKTSSGTLAFFYYTTINRFKEKLGGGGACEVQKTDSRKGKLNEKKFMHAN